VRPLEATLHEIKHRNIDHWLPPRFRFNEVAKAVYVCGTQV